MSRWNGRVALVAGASAGIGAAICKTLVQSGMTVIGAARRVEKVEDLADSLKGSKGSLIGKKCDLNEDENISQLFQEIKSEYGGVDICINNAGHNYENSLLEGTPEEWRQLMNLNVIALCHCSKLSIASMRERGVDDGHIININSVAGHTIFNFPNFHFYSATKFAVTAISEGLRQEMRALKSHIRITSISPGAVKTEFVARMHGEKVAEEFFKNLKMVVLQPEDIAASVLHVINAPSHVEINEMIIRPTESNH